MQKSYIRIAMGTVVACSWLWAGAANASSTSSCATPDDNSTISTCYYDLTEAPSSTQDPASAVLNGGIFRTPQAIGGLGKGTIVGTGTFNPFVRIQVSGNGNSSGVESGFNTGGNTMSLTNHVVLDDHDKGNSNWNHAIQLKDVPIVHVCSDGSSDPSCPGYYEFLLDTNEQGNDNGNKSNAGISLDEFKLFWADTGDLTGVAGTVTDAGFSDAGVAGANLAYNMDAGPGGDASILMDYNNFSGSGNGVDLQALVPVANLALATGDSYLYLYSKFGATGDTCKVGKGQTSGCMTPDGTDGTGKSISDPSVGGHAGDLSMIADAGFEEWSIRKKVPLPPTALLLGLGLVALVRQRKSQQRKASFA